jgi:hypothetical protein
MTEPPLDRPGVVPLVGERVAAGMAKHMRMGLQLEAGADGRALNHPGKASGRERSAASAKRWRGTASHKAYSGRQSHLRTP